MLEIIGMIAFYRKLKSMLEEKGRGAGLAFIGPLFWLIGEFGGAFACGIILAILKNDTPMLAYVGAIIGAVTGGMTAYFIVRFLPPLALYCPACQSELPADIGRSYAKHTCDFCNVDLRISGGQVTQL